MDTNQQGWRQARRRNNQLPIAVKTQVLDKALVRLLGEDIPGSVRDLLRRPLWQWFDAAQKFMASKFDRAAFLRFWAAEEAIKASYPSPRREAVLLMTDALHRHHDILVEPCATDCSMRFVCGIAALIHSVFGDEEAA
jgi:hypothetical protein